jgi:hypothetical protein
MVMSISALAVTWLTTVIVAYTAGDRNGYRAGKRDYKN